MQHIKRNLGFTLVELMVTIAVLAIIAMMAAPNMIQMVYKKQLEASARELAMTLSNIRSTAISLRKDISLEFKDLPSDGDHFYWVSPRSTIHILAKGLPQGIFFTPTGLAKLRTVSLRNELIINPDYDPLLPEDPLTNPKKIIKWEDTNDLVMEICHEKLSEIKSIKIFKSGVIDNIQTKPLVGECR